MAEQRADAESDSRDMIKPQRLPPVNLCGTVVRFTDNLHRLLVALPLVLVFTCPSRLGKAYAQEVLPVGYLDHWGAGPIADVCHDASTLPALRNTMRLVCSRAPVEAANQNIRKAIILGFVGGFVKGNDPKHPEVLFATYLQARYGSTVYVNTFGNHEGKQAVEDTLRRLDTDKDGFLTATEKQQVKIILYGHSWGASQVLTLARELQRRGIPVALTIQIDTVKKCGQNDRTVPANVGKAVNFYQRKGLTPGQPLIVPADAARTTILGNFNKEYRNHEVDCDNYGWLSRAFNKPHHQIENDPHIWDQIASLIDSEVLRTGSEINTASSSMSAAFR